MEKEEKEMIKDLKIWIFILTGALVLWCSGALYSQDEIDLGEIVVTATKTEKPIEEVVNNITVITPNKIENKNSLTLSDLIRDISGVDVSRTGSFGSTTSIFLRGCEAKHTQILIDGIKLQDAMSIDRSFGSAHLIISNNFERVEILKGSQSVLYGSDAIGGVINIITSKEKKGVSLFMENGAYNSSKIDLQVQDKIKKFSYNLSLLKLTTDGYSSADEKDGNKEKDGYDNTTYSLNLQYKNIGFLLHKIEGRTEIDGWDWVNNKLVDADFVSFTNTKIFSPYINYNISQNLTQNLRYSKVENIRDDMLSSWPEIYSSEVERFELQNNYRIKNNDIIFGYEKEEEKGSSKFFDKKEAETSSYYLQNQIKSKNFIVNTGLRYIKHSKFGKENVFKSSFGYLIDNLGLRIKTNYSTGFNTPSLYQLFDQWSGEPNLKPEEAKSFDMGFDKKFKDKIYLDMTYFNNKFENLIQYVPIGWAGKYKNIGKAKTSGIETSVIFNLTRRLSLNTQYTITKTENEITGEELLKRPKNKFGAGLKYNFKSGSLNLYNLHTGKRKDFPYVELPPYNKTDLTILYHIGDNQIIAKIENLLDKYYQETKGYGTPGRSFYLGLRKKVEI